MIQGPGSLGAARPTPIARFLDNRVLRGQIDVTGWWGETRLTGARLSVNAPCKSPMCVLSAYGCGTPKGGLVPIQY